MLSYNLATADPLFLLLLQKKNGKKKTSLRGFRFPLRVSLTDQENRFGFFGSFPRGLADMRQKFPFSASPLASPFGRAKGRCKYVLLSKFRWHLLLTALVQRHNEANLMPTTTGGAYYSARIVTQCECRSFQIVFLLKLHCSMHQPYPAPLFSPIFSGKAEKIGPSET